MDYFDDVFGSISLYNCLVIIKLVDGWLLKGGFLFGVDVNCCVKLGYLKEDVEVMVALNAEDGKESEMVEFVVS